MIENLSPRHYYQDLLHAGWIDSWRSRDPETREFTWTSNRTENRFRYDQILASTDMDARFRRVSYDHAARLAKYSDHSLIIAHI